MNKYHTNKKYHILSVDLTKDLIAMFYHPSRKTLSIIKRSYIKLYLYMKFKNKHLLNTINSSSYIKSNRSWSLSLSPSILIYQPNQPPKYSIWVTSLPKSITGWITLTPLIPISRNMPQFVNFPIRIPDNNN